MLSTALSSAVRFSPHSIDLSAFGQWSYAILRTSLGLWLREPSRKMRSPIGEQVDQRMLTCIRAMQHFQRLMSPGV